MHAKNSIRKILTSKSFGIGLISTIGIYALLAGWVYIDGGKRISDMEGQLASHTSSVDHFEKMEESDPVSPPPDKAEEVQAPDINHTPDNSKNAVLELETASTEIEPDADKDATNMNMRSAPYTGLYELNSQGAVLPVIRSEDGLTSFQTYRKPFLIRENDKLISIVIDDYGLSRGISSEMAANLNENVSFILSPYTLEADKMAQQARDKGHEIWLKLPFENQNFPYDDPGSKAILSRLQLSANMANLKWSLSQASGYAGVALFQDITFTKARPTLSALIKECIDRGLGLFDINISAPSGVSDMATQRKSPYIKNQIIFHDPKWNGNMNEAAELLETIAESRGYGVAVFKTYPDALKFLQVWLPDLQNKGYVLSPLSAIYLKENMDRIRPMPPIETNANSIAPADNSEDAHAGQH